MAEENTRNTQAGRRAGPDVKAGGVAPENERRRGGQKKPHQRTVQDDIRYWGPISYQGLLILGWLCIVFSVAVVLLSICMSMGKGVYEKWYGTRQILLLISQLSVPFLLIASFSQSMTDNSDYGWQLLIYGGLAVLVSAGSWFLFSRYLIGTFEQMVTKPAEVLPLVTELFARYNENGFIVFNVFIDILLCTLIGFFVNYRPKRFLTGRRVLILRAGVILPIAYELASIYLKYLSVRGKIRLPLWSFSLLTVRAPITYLLFLFLAIHIKLRQRRFCCQGRTYEEYQAFMRTRSNSLHFGVVLAVSLVFAAMINGFLTYCAREILLPAELAEEGSDWMAWSIRAGSSIGFGDETAGLLIAAPLMLLYAFNRVPRWPVISLLTPMMAVVLIGLLILESVRAGTGVMMSKYNIPKLDIDAILDFINTVKALYSSICALLF